MKKRLIALVLSIILTVGNVGAVPVFAAETTAEEAVPVEEQVEVSEEIEDADPNIVTEKISVDDPAEPVEEEIGPESGESIEESESIYEQDAVEEGKPAEEAISSDEEEEEYPIEAEEIALEEDIVTNEDNKVVGDVVASGTCGESLTWELEDGTLTISGTGEMYEMYQFNNSGKYYAPWYSCREQITTIVINSGVTSISSYAFIKCSNLTSVTIPDSVTGIGGYAFCNCSSLTSVTIGNGVTIIENAAFQNCSSLTSVSIGRGVTSIWSDAFSNCSSLTSVTIPNSVTSIGGRAFSGCSSLASVTIPDSVTSIGDCAFQNCSSLTSVSIGSSVTSIWSYAFSNCSSLTSVTIPDSVTNIGGYAFSNCSNLMSVTIPDSVTSIGDYVFQNCSNLTRVTIPDSVTSIGDGAFYGCSSLTSVTIPDSVTTIKSYTFYGCSSLTSVTIPDSVTIIESYTFYGCSSLTSVTIPDGVTTIKSYTFYGCSSLTSVTIPDGVKYIGEYEFYRCSNLTSVTIPDSVTNIGSHAFSGCSSLTSVAIPDSVIYISDNAFFGCSNLTSVTIPDSVTIIEGSAFYNCSSLTSVTIGSGVKTIRNYAFYNCSSLTSVTIGSGVTGIQSSAFRECSSLTSVTIPDGVTTIESYTFYGCSGLTSVTIGSGVISIESYAFCNCSSLTSVTIPDGVTYISNHTFCKCSSLTSVTIPNSVTSIGDNAFSGCSSLTNVTIPNSVTSIRSYAFSNCSNLTSVTIPDSVTSIQSSAFRECSNLKSVYFTGDAPSFGNEVFKNATLTAYYPKNNATWTDSVKQNYGGTITWVTWSPGYNGFDITNAKIMMMYDFENEDHKKCIAYSGSEITPVYDVCIGDEDKSLEENKDYTLTYKDNKDIGIAQCTVKGIGEYYGDLTVEFLIVPAKVNNLRGNNDLSTDALAYTNYRRGLDIIWDAQNLKDIKYEIQYSKTNDFREKGIMAVLTNEYSELEKPLERKSTYYVRVRAYLEKTAGEYIDGEWSDILKVQTGGQILASEMWAVRNSTKEHDDFVFTKKQFQNVFKEGEAELLFDYYCSYLNKDEYGDDWVKAGLCDGLVNSGIAYYEYDTPAFGSYSDRVTEKNYKSMKSSAFNLKWLDIVKYAQLVQCAVDPQEEARITSYSLNSFYDAVKNCEMGAGAPASISFGRTTLGGHEILAIGISNETKDKVEIEVYDVNSIANNNAVPRYLYLYKTGELKYKWEYENLKKVNSNTGEAIETETVSGNIYENPGVVGAPYFCFTTTSASFVAQVLNDINRNGSVKETDVKKGPTDKYESALELENWYEDENIFQQNILEQFNPLQIQISQGNITDDNINGTHAYWICDDNVEIPNVPEGVKVALASGNHYASLQFTEVSDVYLSVADSKPSVLKATPKNNGSCEIKLLDGSDEQSVSVECTHLSVDVIKNQELIIERSNDALEFTGTKTVAVSRISGNKNENGGLEEEPAVQIVVETEPNIRYRYLQDGDTAYIVGDLDDDGEYETIVTEQEVSPNKLDVSKYADISGIRNKTYTGRTETQNPVVTLDGKTLVSGTDYTVNFENNTKPGTATVTITGIGNYTGTITKTFLILPGKTTRGDMFNLANNVKVTWKEVPGAKYYKVYREGITDKKESQTEPVIVTDRLVGWDKQPGLTNGHAYRYKIVASLTGKGDLSGDSTLSYSKLMYRLKTVVIRSVKNTAPGKVTVKYDKTVSGDSYVLQFCEREDMVGAKTKVVLGANNTSYTIGGLKKGKTYYISIRVRKKVNGIDYYTTFGVAKKITITK